MYRLIIIALFALLAGCSTVSDSLGEGAAQDYTLLLSGLGPNTRAEFEETISHFQEYRSHTLLDTNNGSYNYYYSMALTPSEFRDSLSSIIARLELPAILRYSGDFRFEIASSR